jgi:predicted O-methyltransferase YrrM
MGNKQNKPLTLEQAIKGIDYHLWSSEPEVGKFLVALLKMTNSSTVIEVGTFKGLTSCYLIDALKESGKFYSIDIEDHRGGSVKQYFEENKDTCKFILGDSLVKLKDFEENSADIIFLDSYHGLEQVRGEFKLSEKIIKPNGYICIHDYYSSDGVPIWVDYLKSEQFKGSLKFMEIINLETPEHRGFTIVRYIK